MESHLAYSQSPEAISAWQSEGEQPEETGQPAALAPSTPEILRQRRRKGKMREYDLRPLIDELRYDGRVADDGYQRLWMRLRLGSGATGRPDEVLAALGLERQPRRITRRRLLWRDSGDSEPCP